MITTFKETASEAPSILGGEPKGNAYNFGDVTITLPKGLRLVVRYLLASLSDDGQRSLLESLETRALSGVASALKAPGDLAILSFDKTFTKDGDYVIAVRFVEVVDISTGANT